MQMQQVFLRGDRVAFPARCPSKARAGRRHALVARAAASTKDVYVPPSRATAANELQGLERWSTVVPDTVLMKEFAKLEEPKAATVSSSVLSGILANAATMFEYRNAVERALTYDKCAVEGGGAKAACQFDKALANVGAMFAKQVQGRVSTEVDPRVAHNADAIVARALNLVELYRELGVGKERVIMRIPATWEGIQAAGQLEAQGVATHLILVYSFVQGAAAAAAGASVLQPNVGRIADWYARNPGVIRDPSGPREDSGYASTANPGLLLVERLYNFCQQRHPKTAVMAAGLRNKEDALRLAGCDYLVLSPRVMAALAATPTLEGYNDGLHVAISRDEEGVLAQLSPELAKDAAFSADDIAPVTREAFDAGLGQPGRELLDAGLALLLDDAAALDPVFSGAMALGGGE